MQIVKRRLLRLDAATRFSAASNCTGFRNSNITSYKPVSRRVHVRVIVVGATGTIGKEIVNSLKPNHEVLTASRNSGDFKVDLTDAESIRRLFADVGRFDSV